MVPACADNRGYHRESRSHQIHNSESREKQRKSKMGGTIDWDTNERRYHAHFIWQWKTTTSSDETENFRISVTWIANAPSSQLAT